MKKYSDETQISEEDKAIFHWPFPRFFGNRRRIAATVVLTLIMLGGYLIYQKYFNLTPAEKAQKELAAAVEAVSRHIILPQGDQPVLATVTDAKTLISQQAFFAGAVNGDQLLLFPGSLKAVLYSPSRNVIVNVGPIQQSQALGQPTGASNTEQTTGVAAGKQGAMLSVEVRNGTSKNGFAAQIAGLISANPEYSVINSGDAKNRNYKKTVVVNRTSDSAKNLLANTLAQALGADVVSDLPAGEKDTGADALVILGGNQ